MKFSGDSEKRQKKQKTKSEKSKGAGKSASPGKTIGIIAAITVTLLIVALLAVGAYANGIELIYPNVSMSGVDLSGMTIAEAADTLSEGAYITGQDKQLVIAMPADVELIVSAKDAGYYVSAPDAAVFVYEYCHGGSFFGNTITYLKCLFGSAELTIGDGAELDESYLQRVVSDAVRQVQLALLDANIDIGEESITVIKGASSMQIDGNRLLGDVKQALLDGKFEPLEYSAVIANDTIEEIDLEKLYDTVFLEPINAVYDPETKGATESVNGRSFDMKEAQRLWNSASVGETVVIPIIIEEPEISTQKLEGMLFADLLAQKSTTLSGSSYGRINNIKKASETINGLVLNPGEEFSFNGIVGQRTPEKGYMAAGAYNNGQVVQEVGGGICQVSSTIYYCALISNLEITNRLCHYFGVAYLPAGLDATVSWPSPDFKFKNSSEYPIRIEAHVDNATNSCVVKIYGSNPDGIRVEMATESLYYNDGYGAVSYRLVYDRDGALISKTEEARSRYYHHVEEREEASPSPDPEESPSPGEEPTSPGPSESTPPTESVAPTPSEPVEPPPTETPTGPVAPPPEEQVE